MITNRTKNQNRLTFTRDERIYNHGVFILYKVIYNQRIPLYSCDETKFCRDFINEYPDNKGTWVLKNTLSETSEEIKIS